MVFDGGMSPTGLFNISFLIEKINKGLASGARFSFGTGVGVNAPDGEMFFKIGPREILRIDHEGRFIRDGNVVTEDKDVALVLRAWLGYCCVAMGREQDRLISAENRVAELEAELAKLGGSRAREEGEKMSIVDMDFISALVAAELPTLLVLLEETTEDFHVVAKQHAEADTRRQVAIRLMTIGAHIEPVIAHAVEDQRLQCLLDQYRERVALVRGVLQERVMSMAAIAHSRREFPT